MFSFSNIAYVPKTNDNLFMGSLDDDESVFHLLCKIYEESPALFHEFENFAFMSTEKKDISTGELIYAWFTPNKNYGALQKWYNSGFKTESELLKISEVDKFLHSVEPQLKAETELQSTTNMKEKKQESKKKENITSKAFIETFPQELSNLEDPNKIVLIPDQDAIQWIYTENSNRKCAICTISVAPDWIHFDDFLKHGLDEFWDYAHENQDMQCMLILQNINVTLIQIALTPLIDVISKYRPRLPFSGYYGYPKNLTIYCTLANAASPLAVPLEQEFIDLCDILSKKNITKDTICNCFAPKKTKGDYNCL